jgi:hypothetical protein
MADLKAVLKPETETIIQIRRQRVSEGNEHLLQLFANG